MNDFEDVSRYFNGANFLSSNFGLRKSPVIEKILVIGSCLSEGLFLRMPWEKKLIPYNGGELDEQELAEKFSICLIQIPLRAIIPDSSFWNASQRSSIENRKVFREFRANIKKLVSMFANSASLLGTPKYFLNFSVPSINPMGLAMRKSSFGNIQHVIARLNEALDSYAHSHDDTYVIDFDSIIAAHGKRFFSDEIFSHFSHGGMRAIESNVGEGRIESVPPWTAYFQSASQTIIYDSIINQLISLEAIRQRVDPVKLIMVDLDDTLWRGVVGELLPVVSLEKSTADYQQNPYQSGELGHLVEGWPLGLVEALMYCRQRGIILSIVSKNDYATVERAFPLLFHSRLALTDFAVVKINRDPKASNIRDILKEVNVLSAHALFIDDSPIERESVASAFPEMRVWGRHFLLSRWWLLSGAIFQVPVITDETSKRNEMIVGQLARESERFLSSSHEAFLKDAKITCRIFDVTAESDIHPLNRAVELINKTNQWNLSGIKVTGLELTDFVKAGGRIFGASCTDRYTAYGMIAFLLFNGRTLLQFVMSCRVFGMGLESFILRSCMGRLDLDSISFKLASTQLNRPLQEWLGSVSPDGSTLTLQNLQSTEHISLAP